MGGKNQAQELVYALGVQSTFRKLSEGLHIVMPTSLTVPVAELRQFCSAVRKKQIGCPEFQ